VWPAATRSGYKVAVRDVSFGARYGECFGFLGVNGAGKTTTLSMLSGDVAPTSGGAYVAGVDVLGEKTGAVRERLGVCPQHNSLLELLTVREHLELVAELRGATWGAGLEEAVEEKIKKLDLESFRNVPAGNLSGGNQRKLQVAMATMGDPAVVLLDEPSSGMDPVARRFMWGVTARLASPVEKGGSGACVILTTHAMEECEALCNRIGIMVNGRLRCLGSAQRLKARFGDGFELSVSTRVRERDHPDVEGLVTRLRDAGALDARGFVVESGLSAAAAALGDAALAAEVAPGGSGATLHAALQADGRLEPAALAQWWLAEQDAAALRDGLNQRLEGAELLERPSMHAFKYRVPAGAGRLDIAQLFNIMGEVMASLTEGAQFAVGQTTLDAVFNSFAREGEREAEEEERAAEEAEAAAARTAGSPPARSGSRTVNVVDADAPAPGV